MTNRSILGVIPARYRSTRFEGKPLVPICGIPMIKRTYTQARKSSLLSDLVVATEDSRIVDYCRAEDIPVVMTSTGCLTGTDRLAEVARLYKHDLYVNIQGDEPVIDPQAISQVVEEYAKHGDEYVAYNLYKIIHDPEEIGSRTIVKVVVNESDELMYMSRYPIPFSNSGETPFYKQQIPVYGFTQAALELFSSRAKTLNERFEDVEILRFIDLGFKVKMRETLVTSIAVDVPADVEKVERFLRNNAI